MRDYLNRIKIYIYYIYKNTKWFYIKEIDYDLYLLLDMMIIIIVLESASGFQDE
jgi:hypothetical protein